MELCKKRGPRGKYKTESNLTEDKILEFLANCPDSHVMMPAKEIFRYINYRPHGYIGKFNNILKVLQGQKKICVIKVGNYNESYEIHLIGGARTGRSKKNIEIEYTQKQENPKQTVNSLLNQIEEYKRREKELRAKICIVVDINNWLLQKLKCRRI